MNLSLNADLAIVATTALAFVLGWALGYERYYHGHAAGTQVYCIVAMASCALTAATGFDGQWFHHAPSGISTANTTQVVASLLTGIGFLGAGIIVKSDKNIRGLTTAASIWSSAAIGILVGLDLFGAAIGITALFIGCMSMVSRLERQLPGHMGIMVTLRYRPDVRPHEEDVDAFLRQRGLAIQRDSVSITFDGRAFVLEFLTLARAKREEHTLARVAEELPKITSVETFSVARTTRG